MCSLHLSYVWFSTRTRTWDTPYVDHSSHDGFLRKHRSRKIHEILRFSLSQKQPVGLPYLFTAILGDALFLQALLQSYTLQNRQGCFQLK